MTDLFEVKIPHSGSVENVEITEWLAAVGDVVAQGAILAEVSTDKVDTELTAPQSGKIARLVHDAGVEVTVGTTVALMVGEDTSDEDAAAAVSSWSPRDS